MLIVGGEVDGRGPADVRLSGEVIAEVATGLDRRPGEQVVDARGGAVIPALHDHHVHLRALAAARGSVDVGPPATVDAGGFTARLRAAARDAGPGGWVRAVGYHDTVAGPLDRARLDAAVADHPVRVQHRSGALWVLNTPALDATGAAHAPVPGVERDEHGVPTGRLWRLDRWLAGAVPPAPLAVAAVARDAAGLGVAGFTDADPHRLQTDVDLLAAAAERDELPQRLVLMGAAGLTLPATGQWAAGPRKLLLDDATLPPVAELAAWFAAAHADGEPVAVHCVTRLQLVATLAALADAGPRPGDRVEHAAVVPPELHAEMRRLGVTVVTQPNFVAERGDTYLDEVDPEDRPLLYPCARLRAAGIGVAAGTDAPFGRPDPWAAMRAATRRRTASGVPIGPDERVDADTALGLFLGDPGAPAAHRRLRPGAPADVCVLDRPRRDVLATLLGDAVAVTVGRGRIIADNR